jgi:hypothetical protein
VNLPERFPPVLSLTVGIDNSAWMEVPSGTAGQSDWLVIPPSGNREARVTVEGSARLVLASMRWYWIERVRPDGTRALEKYQNPVFAAR